METLEYILLGFVLMVFGSTAVAGLMLVWDFCEAHPRITFGIVFIPVAWGIGYLSVNSEPWWTQ